MPFNEVRINTAVDGFGKRSGAVERVHGDYTNTSGPRMLEELAERGVLPKGFELGSKRGAILNVWRNASPVAVQQKPLAVLDARTVDEKDLGLYYVRADPNPYPNSTLTLALTLTLAQIGELAAFVRVSPLDICGAHSWLKAATASRGAAWGSICRCTTRHATRGTTTRR